MAMEIYNYELIAQHRKLLAVYSGWVGQKICFLTHSAVAWDRSNHWSAASAEMDRLVVVMHEAEKAKVLNLSGETGAILGKLIGHFAAGGWWTSRDGVHERRAIQQASRELEKFPDHEPDPDYAPFQPRLLLEHDPSYPIAATAINQLDAVLMQAAVAMDNLDECRLGVSLAGFGYRNTPQLGIPFVDSVFNDLAARGLIDVQAENEFRRALGLARVAEDRGPQLYSDPALIRRSTPDGTQASHGGSNSFTSVPGDRADIRGLVLGCVFSRFDVMVPPAECDATQYPELVGLKRRLQATSVTVTKPISSNAERERPGKGAGVVRDHLWIDDAIAYLGADELGVNPKKFIYRLIKKGALPAKKINGRFVFFKADLDRMIANGDHKRTRGRPRKGPSA